MRVVYNQPCQAIYKASLTIPEEDIPALCVEDGTLDMELLATYVNEHNADADRIDTIEWLGDMNDVIAEFEKEGKE